MDETIAILFKQLREDDERFAANEAAADAQRAAADIQRAAADIQRAEAQAQRAANALDSEAQRAANVLHFNKMFADLTTLKPAPALPINRPINADVVPASNPSPSNALSSATHLTGTNFRLTFNTSEPGFSLDRSIHHLLVQMQTIDPN